MQVAPNLQSYVLVEQIGEGLQSLLYKGFHKSQPDQPLLIKLLKQDSTSGDQSRHLRQKIERLKVLHDPRVCIPLAFVSEGERQFIVQPWFSGQPLDVWASQQEKISLKDFFNLACSLADILQAVHDSGITHGGIKPHNILVQPGTLTLRLTDFITPLDIRDVSHFIYDPEFIRGTLAYTSPEQTGRINYRVDFATDLYSLGIVFYELLTGKLPFFSDDPLELIHSHLAEEAIRVDELNPEIPRQLGRIIAKLMVKQPEKRYQSAGGLLGDLIRCRDEFATTGTVSDFHIGLKDVTRRVVFISKMVGRKNESALIQREYDAVSQGAFRSVFISGLSGIGKTRLIQELQRPLVQHRGYFTSGKFDQYQKNIPYSSLIQALRNLMRIFLTESDARVAQWRTRVLAAVETNGRVITDVVPELEFIIGPQPEVAHLPPVEARNRFNNLFGRFLSCLASADNPLVMFIDDLQWCDSATFDFLSSVFANHQEHPYLFFIGAYRHNEVDASHPLIKLIRSIREDEGPLQEVRLTALDDEDTHEMVAYILDSPLKSIIHLANFIAQLTEGNPLFVSESLAWLYNQDLLYADEEHHWQWDMNKIRDAQMPSTVVELFSSKVSKLPPETLHILNHCACMGNRFTAEDVALVVEISLEKLFEDLKPVLSLGLLLENKSDLQFVHDRVQEAVLRQVDENLRPAIHWHIGNRLLGAVPPGTDLEHLDNLFTIVAHLNKGRPAELDEAATYHLVEINFHAGNKALDALAGDAANDFYLMAHDLLPPDCWQTTYEKTYRIYQRLAKTCLMRGRYEDSEELLNQLIEHAISDLDKAEALAEQTTSLSSFGNFIKAIETANRGLSYFSKEIPGDDVEAWKRMQTLMAQIAEKGDVWDKILHMPFTKERKSKIELAFYSELIPDLYMSGLVPQLYLSAAQSTMHSLEGGMDESVIYSFSIMGLNLGEQEQFEQAFRYEDLAHDLCARHPNTFGATRGMNGIVWCNMHSRSGPAEIVDYALKGIQCGRNCGDLYNAGLSYGPLMWNLAIQSRNLAQTEEYAEECLGFSKKNQLSFSVALADAVLAGWVAPMKPNYQPVEMKDKLAHWAEQNYVAASGSYFVLLSISQYFLGDYQAAAVSLEAVEQYLHGLTDNVLKRLWYVFRTLNRLRLADESTEPEIQAEIAPFLEKIETWARLGPLLRPYLAFIRAEMALARGEAREARNLYLDAIAEAQEQDYGLLSGHLYECLADLLSANKLGPPEIFYAEARRLYQVCRADGKNARLQKLHGFLPADMAFPSGAATNGYRDSFTLPNLDINYLMKSALALSAEIDLTQLLQKIMNVVLESSGAQHGYLLVKEQDELVVAAENHVGKRLLVINQRYSLANAREICQAIVNYVYRTREKVVLRDAGREGAFQDADEVQALELRSVMCLPVIKQAELVGVLYLENRLSEGIFTPEKIGMTELLTSHAAISLENARLLEDTRFAHNQLQEALGRLNEIASQVPGAVFQFRLYPNKKFSIPYASEGLRTIFRINPEDVREDAAELFLHVHPEDINGCIASIAASATNLRPWIHEFRVQLDDGFVRWYWGNALPQKTADGSVLWHGFISDITQRKKNELELLKYRAIIESSDEAIISKTLYGTIESWNRGAEKIFGYTAEEAIGTSMQILMPPDRPNEEKDILVRIAKGEKVDHFETVRRHKDGRLIDISTTISPMLDKEGNVIGVSTIARDITERHKIDAELRIAAAVFEAQEGMFVTDSRANILRVNHAFTSITGYSAEEVIGKNPSMFKSGRHDQDFYTALWESVRKTGAWEGEIWNKRKNGEVFPEHLTITAVKNSDGTIGNYVATLTDITELKRHQHEVERIAYYDPLTQLPNRRLLADRMRQALARSKRSHDSVCVVCIDLDGFKAVNDTLGHEAGDHLLIEAANRMLRCVRTDDTVSRLGGDEFVILLDGVSSLKSCEGTLSRVLNELAMPFNLIEGRVANISGSIGYTLYPEDDVDADTLLRHADHAMYSAKQAGKNRYHLFDLTLDSRTKANLSALARIEKALRDEEFRLYVQPKINLSTGKISGAEALIRWQHPVRGLIPPSEFLPLIEEHDLALKVGDWVIREGLKLLRTWAEQGLEIVLSVNVSPRQLREKDFSKRLEVILKSYHEVLPQNLEIEIVESAALDDIQKVSELIWECKALGVRFSLDDFGTGYSTLTYLKRLSVDTLKIDQSFVRDMMEDDSAQAIVRGVIGLAEAFHSHTVGEGVESWEVATRLKELGCDIAQGYAIARPMPAEEVLEWVNNFKMPKI